MQTNGLQGAGAHEAVLCCAVLCCAVLGGKCRWHPGGGVQQATRLKSLPKARQTGFTSLLPPNIPVLACPQAGGAGTGAHRAL